MTPSYGLHLAAEVTGVRLLRAPRDGAAHPMACLFPHLPADIASSPRSRARGSGASGAATRHGAGSPRRRGPTRGPAPRDGWEAAATDARPSPLRGPSTSGRLGRSRAGAPVWGPGALEGLTPKRSQLTAYLDVLLGEVEAGRLPPGEAYPILLEEACLGHRPLPFVGQAHNRFRLAFRDHGEASVWGPTFPLHLLGPDLPEVRRGSETVCFDFATTELTEHVDIALPWPRPGPRLASRLSARSRLRALGPRHLTLEPVELSLACLETGLERQQAWRYHLGRGERVRTARLSGVERRMQLDAFDGEVVIAWAGDRGLVLRRVGAAGIGGPPVVGSRRAPRWP